MRAASDALKAYLAAVRAGTQPLRMADCYTFTLRSGTVLRVCDKDIPVVVGADTFVANSIQVGGLTYKCAVGLDVDTQELDIAARPTDLVDSVPVLVALRNGAFDGCRVTRDRAFLKDWTAPAIGSVNLFTGKIATIDSLGRTSAQVTVASDLSLLSIDMPRNLYQPMCNWQLYGVGCGLDPENFSASGTVGAGSTRLAIAWANAGAAFALGKLTFTSGALAGVTVGIKDTAAHTSLTLSMPLETPPQAGDTFVAYYGCDHTPGANGCAKFDNLVNFRGFPHIPPPTTTYAQSGA